MGFRIYKSDIMLLLLVYLIALTSASSLYKSHWDIASVFIWRNFILIWMKIWCQTQTNKQIALVIVVYKSSVLCCLYLNPTSVSWSLYRSLTHKCQFWCQCCQKISSHYEVCIILVWFIQWSLFNPGLGMCFS